MSSEDSSLLTPHPSQEKKAQEEEAAMKAMEKEARCWYEGVLSLLNPLHCRLRQQGLKASPRWRGA
jgi:hypothetical protein